MSTNDDPTDDSAPWSWTTALYVAWAVILVVSLLAGGYTLGFLVDTESIGTSNNPNAFQAVEEWSGFSVTNTDSTSGDGSYSNDESYSNDGTANTQSDVEAEGLLACDANAFCSARSTR